MPGINTATLHDDAQTSSVSDLLALPPLKKYHYLRVTASPEAVINKVNELDARLRDQEVIAGRLILTLDAIEKRCTVSDNQAATTTKALATLLDRIEAAEDKLVGHVDKITANEDALEELFPQVHSNTNNIDRASKQLGYIEVEARRKILVLENYKESQNQNLREVVEQLFKDLQVPFNATAVEAVYRRGRKPKSPKARARPIVVVFTSQLYKSQVFQNVSNLRGINQWYRVSPVLFYLVYVLRNQR